jgi:hydroxymethylpyrimidine pyrophosphatase-like HAD family hydrolase
MQELVSLLFSTYNESHMQNTFQKKEIRLISTDLDGTLLNHMSEVSQRSCSALKEARARGIIVVINSGRPYASVRSRIPAELYDYASCMNGQDVYAIRTDTHLEMPCLEVSDLHALYEIACRHMTAMEIYQGDHTVTACGLAYAPLGHLYAMASWLHWRLRGFHPRRTAILTGWHEDAFGPSGKACFAGSSRTLRKILEELPPGLAGTFVNLNWLEVQKKGISKGLALQKIMAAEHIDAAAAVGFGDGENDISMLDACGIRIAMANAMPVLKAHADETALSNEADGVAAWLEENVL